MIFSVWLYLVLLPPYTAQHYLSIPWQLVLDDMLEDVLESPFYHSKKLSHVVSKISASALPGVLIA